MKVFVTGGGGFLGYAIVQVLLGKGYDVVTYSRTRHAALDKLSVKQYQGNLTDLDSILKAMKGCEAVFHVAAKTGIWGSYHTFHETNVTGTENIIKACLEAGVRYLIYSSSASVIYKGNAEGDDESLPYPDKFEAYYPLTKAIAEKAVLKANNDGLVTCAIRPHLIWGPGDPHFLPRLFAKQKAGKLRIIGDKDCLVDTTYIDNAANAHILALETMLRHPDLIGGKPYFISQGEPIPVHDFINRLLATGGLPPVTKHINPGLALAAGWLLERVYRLLHISSEPPLTLFLARQLSTAHWYNISAARKELGYTPAISISEGMERLMTWVKSGNT